MELSPEFRRRFVKSVNGKDFVLYGGLLELAKQKGLRGISVDICQLPTNENNMLAVCEATVFFGDDGTYTDVGDASPDNVSHAISKHIVRMASTRAKARALRDALGIDMVALEELADENDVMSGHAAGGGQGVATSSDGHTQAGDTVINFGKYNGMTLRKLKETDCKYLEWLANNAKDEALRREAVAVLCGVT